MSVVKSRRRATVRSPHPKIGSALPTLFMVAFLVYFMLPLVWLLVASTKTNESLFASFGFWFTHPFNFIENVRGVFSYDNGVFWHWLENSAIYSITSAGGAALLATLAGYGFAKYEFRGYLDTGSRQVRSG